MTYEKQETPSRRRRGFGAMSAEQQREIARKGGVAAHARGSAHEFSVDEARAAGKKGGQTVSRDREHMARIGRQGGRRARANRSATPEGPDSLTSDAPKTGE
jgi:general stress protein YciG